ncbi:hypothetical protein V6N12_012638 [Hibiscus sabdariffa]|uniref:Reverse transcriptase domain-containing protein n=1 Tax=Hibiscus sabdariffa TaxID=183260 RepID=A0ABR2DD34_9ROSI
MHEAWERYRDLFRRYPMHGLPKWTQVSIFYNSVNTPTWMMLDNSANGTLLDKPPREGLEILEKRAQNDYQHPTTRRGSMRRGTTQLESSDTILAQISALTIMVKNMQKQSNIQEVKVMDSFYELCGNNHDSSKCEQNLESNCYVGNYNRNVMSNTYNPTWKKYPNFSWQNQNNTLNPNTSNHQGYQTQPRQNQPLNPPRKEYQQPNNYKTLENTLNTFMIQTSAYMARTYQFIQKIDQFMDRTEMKMQNQEATLKSLENQFGKQGEDFVAKPNAATVLDGPASVVAPVSAKAPDSTGEDHEIPLNPKETDPVAAAPQPKLPRTDTLEDIRPPPPFP